MKSFLKTFQSFAPLCLLLVLIACGQTAATTSSSTVKSVEGLPGNHSELVNLASGKCIDIAGGNNSNGAGVIIYDCTGAWNQKWQMIESRYKGEYFIRSEGGRCLDLPGGSRNDYQKMQIWDCVMDASNSNQLFWVDRVTNRDGQDAYNLVNKTSFQILHSGGGGDLEQGPLSAGSDWDHWFIRR